MDFYSEHGVRFKGRPLVPTSCRGEVLKEFHHSHLAVHPDGTKMYQDLRRQYWWKGMKLSITEFVSSCLTCQQVKAEHQ